ncbi:tripartite tricarboxylate transporter substrate binding protein [Luteitalea sp.]|uniref:Bug family tripartite tricarboxylate transporter substrate binding protein n=1 Tax=Luteitalea sp. TaxID=2004800 RepID=UPI0025B9406B|nr:tripartite tricarboxylate transporter substrate binding protein [Luteitalea sp.]
MHKPSVKLLALLGAGLLSTHALAQNPAANYPQRPIRVVVGFPPGGATDILARIVSQHMSASWGQSVVVDNRGGAGGTVAADMVSRANPDGYTLMMVPSGPFTISASTYENLPYDTANGFAALSLLAWVTNAIVVPANSPINNLQDLIRMAKEKPGQLSNSSSGNGSLHHLAGEVFKQLTGTKIIHVPFKGGGPALVAISTGEVTFGMSSLPSIMPLLQAKRIRPIVVTSQKRSAALPDVPTIAEAGLPLPAGLEMREWYGMVAPLKTPPAIVEKLNAEMVKIIRRPDVQTRLTEMGAEAAGSTPRELATQIANDVKTWAKVVKETGVKAN